MKNEQIINKIIEIEEKAQELIKSANQEQTELPLKVSQIIEQHKKDYNDKAVKRIETVRIQEDEIAKERIAQILDEHKIKLEKLKKMTDENIDGWTDKVYDFIIQPTNI
ncbi:MAG: hypothetical protein FWD71_07030 [Oscillospiraceae bacterium]|nr:hypothetical protein [Oscillospiraceae bacterium]